MGSLVVNFLNLLLNYYPVGSEDIHSSNTLSFKLIMGVMIGLFSLYMYELKMSSLKMG